MHPMNCAIPFEQQLQGTIAVQQQLKTFRYFCFFMSLVLHLCSLQEDYLSEDEFTKVFGCDRSDYGRLPQWKRLQLKRNVKLF